MTSNVHWSSPTICLSRYRSETEHSSSHCDGLRHFKTIWRRGYRRNRYHEWYEPCDCTNEDRDIMIQSIPFEKEATYKANAGK